MKKMILAAIAMTAMATTAMAQNSNFNYSVDRFADIEVLRYQVPGFEDLSLQQKELVYYLTEAALNGRDILLTRTANITSWCARRSRTSIATTRATRTTRTTRPSSST